MQPPVLLIIEDENDIRILYKSILNKHFDFQIVEADSLQAAKNILKSQKPEYVLLDLCLTDGEGFEIIPELKAKNPEVRILVITAFGHCTDQQKAKELGAFGLLKKPFDKAVFMEYLKAMQNKKRNGKT